ncbi:MAG: cytochrome c [bacterium]|nr:cytochrome c [bacterium]
MTRFLTTALTTAALGCLTLPSIASAGDVAAGNAKFQQLCVSCHGPGGKGDGPTGLALTAAGQPAPRDFTIGEFTIDADKDGTAGSDSDLKDVITKGALVFGGSPMMAPAVGLSDADLDNMIAFIRSLKE